MLLKNNFNIPHLKLFLIIFSFLALFFLCMPTVYVLIWSIKGTSTVGTLGKLTLKWYSYILLNAEWRNAFLYSILIGIASSTISVGSAMLYFYFSLWYRRLYQSVGYFLLIGPLFFPIIVYSLALKVLSSSFHTPEWLTLIVGHIMLLFPVQYFLIESNNELIKIEWIFSAATMGASHREIISRIIMPLLSKPILIAWGIGLIFSFDEIVIAASVIDSANVTIPKKMWEAIHREMNPTPAVVGALILILSLVTLFTFKILQKKYIKKSGYEEEQT